MPREHNYINVSGTGQPDEADVEDIESAERRKSILTAKGGTAEVTISQWMREQLEVVDQPDHERFVVKIGSLMFPVPYEVLAAETDRLVLIASDNDSKYKDVPAKVIQASSEKELTKPPSNEFKRRVFLNVPKDPSR